MKIKLEPVSLGIILGGILFSLYLQWQIPDETYFSGDAGLKALLAQQLSAGQFQFNLVTPAEAWVHDLWDQGFYTYEPPFVYNKADGYFITFPFTLPLISAPLHALFGHRGLYLIPLVSVWALWLTFYWACRRLKLSEFSTSLALVIVIFASHLTLYSAMYWEHAVAVALYWGGMAMLVIPGLFSSEESRGLSRINAIVSGGLIGLAVWFRPEFLSMIASLSILIVVVTVAETHKFKLLNWLNLKPLSFVTKNKELFIASMFVMVGLFFLANRLVYGYFLGMHALEVVEEFSLAQRIAEAWETFQELIFAFFEFFPIAFFPLLYLLLYCFQRLEAKFNTKVVTLGLISLFIAAGAYLLTTGGMAGLRAGVRQGGLPLLIGIGWLYLFRKTEIKFNAKIAIVYLLCLSFTAGAGMLLDSGADEIAVGGKQWGPRYMLSLVPVVSLLTVEQLNRIRTASRPILAYISLALVSLLLILGVHKNTYAGTIFLQRAHQGVVPALEALRGNENRVIVVSHQYAAQILEPPLHEEKVFFRAEDSQALVEFSQRLVEHNQDQFIYVCYPFRECYPPKESPENLRFSQDNQPFQLDLTHLGDFGKYPMYEVSIRQQL